MSLIEDAYEYIKKNLNDSRFMHTLGVVSIAKKLARIHGVSEEKAELSALCHDIAKNMRIEEMEKLMLQNNVVLTEDEKKSPQLWHSILAPIVAKSELNVDDEEILEATRWHTTGKEDMTKLEKIIYISDMIEPSRVYPGVDEIREETIKNLDGGVLLGLTHTIEFLLKQEALIDLNTIKARNYLIINRK
ncbi:bis(5'-nucleosyl)-tetraphosphatase (symmetrical) YqeK [Clostridium paraputrificum]|uniref:bis(5'-nucleosyl)-tetraphosphatase (symmetrical) YqeK n=1 Tax=Clostridium TaxID=1485 RepID=UPI003D3292E1